MSENTNTNSEIDQTLAADDFIVLKEIPALPPEGRNTGNILGVKLETGVDKKDKPFRDLVVQTELDAKQPDGTAFSFEKRYHLAENARGLNAFTMDYQIWTGKKFPADNLNRFQPKSVKGQRVAVHIAHVKAGKELCGEIKRFLAVDPQVAR